MSPAGVLLMIVMSAWFASIFLPGGPNWDRGLYYGRSVLAFFSVLLLALMFFGVLDGGSAMRRDERPVILDRR